MAVPITLYSAYLKRLNKSTLVYISVLLLKDMHNLLTVLHYLTLSQRCRETQCYDKPLKLVRTKKKKKSYYKFHLLFQQRVPVCYSVVSHMKTPDLYLSLLNVYLWARCVCVCVGW